MPPVCESCCSYCKPIVGFGKVAGLMVIVGQLMTSEYVREPVQLLLSVAVTTMLLNVPVCEGVPDNVAVPGLNDRPVGNVPVKLKLTVPMPPTRVKVWL